jgi:hypothetical protein
MKPYNLEVYGRFGGAHSVIFVLINRTDDYFIAKKEKRISEVQSKEWKEKNNIFCDMSPYSLVVYRRF